MAEVVAYRPIPGFPGYRAGDDGSVWVLCRGNKRKKTPDFWRQMRGVLSSGSYYVSLARPDKSRTSKTVASLILRAFVGPRPLGCAPFHFPDPDLANCALGNLRWMPRGSRKIGVPCGPQPKGEESPLAKLSADQARLAMRMLVGGFTQREVAEKFGVSQSTISNVVTEKHWREISAIERPNVGRRLAKGEGNPNSKLNDHDVVAIRAAYRSGRKFEEISREYGIRKTTFYDVVSGRRWAHVPDLCGGACRGRTGCRPRPGSGRGPASARRPPPAAPLGDRLGPELADRPAERPSSRLEARPPPGQRHELAPRARPASRVGPAVDAPLAPLVGEDRDRVPALRSRSPRAARTRAGGSRKITSGRPVLPPVLWRSGGSVIVPRLRVEVRPPGRAQLPGRAPVWAATRIISASSRPNRR
jgi:transposase-like protein